VKAGTTVSAIPVIDGVAQEARTISTGSLVSNPLSGDETYGGIGYQYAYFGSNPADIHQIIEVSVYDPYIYVRRPEDVVSGMKLEAGNSIYLAYTNAQQLNVEYVINPADAANGDYGVKLVGPDTVINTEELKFTLSLGPQYEASSIVIKSGDKTIKTIDENVVSDTSISAASPRWDFPAMILKCLINMPVV
jgi:hypothetical protein